ncbi:heterokaryon incompatibility protein-domain-containing protein [Bipolaris maydis]|nr:heterokaryon incompatibility protein-domain-containing protein [Bipolaris maydis]KAJ6199450.1 heterokaryon incompatibility protein-domain-containing protein [Bipolaris maydis]KAJ6205952.1 heterokaryon incompatibility protein-domain-containing protein [Bipolaris maydis]
MPYLALSYCWGDPKKTVPIYLNNKLVHVTENLSSALQNFEQRDVALRIWIDAICINQKNEHEKSQQVGLMAEIYHKASEVIVWLGDGDENSPRALEILKEIGASALQLYQGNFHGNLDRSNFEGVLQHNVLNTLWARWQNSDALLFDIQLTQRLLLRPWFRRVWVLQEAALNDNVTFYCGQDYVSKDVLWAGVRTVAALVNEVSPLGQAPLWRTVADTDFISRRTLDFVTTKTEKLPLQKLLTQIAFNLGKQAYEATDPRDRIFAILGFSSDSASLGIRPDYDITCSDLYTKVARAILENSETLEILYAVSGNKHVKAIPSWVPDWSVRIPSTFGSRQLGRFCASGYLSQSTPSFASDQYGNKLLVLTGYRVDSVALVLDCQWDPQWNMSFDPDSPVSAFLESLQNFGCERRSAYPTEEERNDALWRTPIADCDAVLDVVRKIRPPATPRMKDSFDALTGVSKGDSSWRAHQSMLYVHTMMLESARRKVFMTSQGYYGLGQESLHVGDSICLLLGGDSPFIIREAGNGYCELIGESYVHGLMHGEFLRTGPSIENFVLC